MKRLKCPYCNRSFRPHPRVGSRQKTCGSRSCKKARKAQTDARWRRKNPDCCQHDYTRVKEWLGRYPNYLEQYRQSHPEYVRKNRQAQKHRDRRKKIHLDIQAQIKNQLPEITEQLWNQPDLDIQASIPLQPLKMTFLFSSFPCLDIQAQMDRPSCLRENGAILIPEVMAMLDKRLLDPPRLRKIQGSFSWIDHRLITGGFLAELSAIEILLYLFLVAVCDRNGISFYHQDKIASLLKIDLASLGKARQGLIQRSLLAYEPPLYQVLSLPPRPIAPLPPEDILARQRQTSLQAIRKIQEAL